MHQPATGKPLPAKVRPQSVPPNRTRNTAPRTEGPPQTPPDPKKCPPGASPGPTTRGQSKGHLYLTPSQATLLAPPAHKCTMTITSSPGSKGHNEGRQLRCHIIDQSELPTHNYSPPTIVKSNYEKITPPSRGVKSNYTINYQK